jgi:hypothetical protein
MNQPSREAMAGKLQIYADKTVGTSSCSSGDSWSAASLARPTGVATLRLLHVSRRRVRRMTGPAYHDLTVAAGTLRHQGVAAVGLASEATLHECRRLTPFHLSSACFLSAYICSLPAIASRDGWFVRGWSFLRVPGAHGDDGFSFGGRVVASTNI